MLLTELEWCPISYFSKKLQPAETRYSTFDRELLGIFTTFCWRTYSTDHKLLTYALSTCADHHSPRQARHLDFISQFTTDIRHVKGIDNAVADALWDSRIEANPLVDSAAPLVDFTAIIMAKAQRTDPELTRLLSSPSSWYPPSTSVKYGRHFAPLLRHFRSMAPYCASSFPSHCVRLSPLTLLSRDACNTCSASSLLGMFGLVYTGISSMPDSKDPATQSHHPIWSSPHRPIV